MLINDKVHRVENWEWWPQNTQLSIKYETKQNNKVDSRLYTLIHTYNYCKSSKINLNKQSVNDCILIIIIK